MKTFDASGPSGSSGFSGTGGVSGPSGARLQDFKIAVPAPPGNTRARLAIVYQRSKLARNLADQD